MFVRPIVLATLVLGASASAAPGKPVDPGTPTGEAARNCIDTRQIRVQRIIDDKTILFRVGRNWFRNDIPNGCIGLRGERAFIYRTSQGTQLCAIDIITVIDPSAGITYGSCGLGKFTPVTLAAK